MTLEELATALTALLERNGVPPDTSVLIETGDLDLPFLSVEGVEVARLESVGEPAGDDQEPDERKGVVLWTD